MGILPMCDLNNKNENGTVEKVMMYQLLCGLLGALSSGNINPLLNECLLMRLYCYI